MGEQAQLISCMGPLPCVQGQNRALSSQGPKQGSWLPGLRAVQPCYLLCAPPTPPHFSPQWIIAELACYTYSMVVVPLYDTLGPGAVRYIINTGEPSCPLLPLVPVPLPRPSLQLMLTV